MCVCVCVHMCVCLCTYDIVSVFANVSHIHREHLGLLDDHPKSEISVKDPVCDAFYEDIWKRTAARNMQLYEEVQAVRY